GIREVQADGLVEGVLDGDVLEGDVVGVDRECRAVLPVGHTGPVPVALPQAEAEHGVAGVSGRGAAEQRGPARADHHMLDVAPGIEDHLADRSASVSDGSRDGAVPTRTVTAMDASK